MDPSENKNAGKSTYGYCDNNPVVYADPNGKDKVVFHYFSSIDHVNQTQQSLIAADNLAPTAVGLPQTASTTSYGWVTVEKNDSKTNTYQIEKINVDRYEGEGPIKTTTIQNINNPEYNFDSNPEFYKALHDFRGTLSGQYQTAYSTGSQITGSAGEIHDLLSREYQYTKEKEIDEKVNAMMLGILEVAASELILARLIEGAGFVGRFVEEGGTSVNMNATSWGSAPMKIERILEQGEKLEDIIDEAKYFTFTTGNEAAVVRLADGQKALVSGGPGGIRFKEGEVQTLFGHTHPKVTGPSTGDYEALEYYDQSKQYIFEGGNQYPIYNEQMFK